MIPCSLEDGYQHLAHFYPISSGQHVLPKWG